MTSNYGTGPMSTGSTSGLCVVGEVGSPMPQDVKAPLPLGFSPLGLADPPTLRTDTRGLWSITSKSAVRYAQKSRLSFRVEMLAGVIPAVGARRAFVLEFVTPREGWRRWFRRFDDVTRWCIPSGTVDEMTGGSVLISADDVGPELGYILTDPTR